MQGRPRGGGGAAAEGMSEEVREVARDVLPLPTGGALLECLAGERPLGVSQSQLRRRRKRLEEDAWLARGAQALNDLYQPGAVLGKKRLSQAQRSAIRGAGASLWHHPCAPARPR